MAKTDFSLQDNEQLLFEGRLNKMTGKISATEGTGFLTNKRLVRYEANMVLRALIGLLALLFKQKLDFEIALDEIRSLKRKDTGFNKKNAFYLTTISGEERELVAFKRDELMAAFQQAFDQHPKLSMAQLSEYEWHVQGASKEAV